ncbi:MAG: aldo/keto reductase [Vibrio sp.]
MIKIGQLSSQRIGLGCMNLSHAYGTPTSEKDAMALLNRALDLGYDHFDTATLYGGGNNEKLLAKAIMHRRGEFLLASKCGMYLDENKIKHINGSPSLIRTQCEQSLQRLKTDVIDLYYLHRWDKTTPIEDTVGELSRLVEEGKIREIGLSEVSAQTLRKAHAIHPIAAVQSEYSLWTRNPEIKLKETCEELGTTLVAFSPLGRGILTGTINAETKFVEKDIRLNMPRFQANNLTDNLGLIHQLKQLLTQHTTNGELEGQQVNLAQLSLAWINSQNAENIISIPGTTSIEHLTENFAAKDLLLSESLIKQMSKIINQTSVSGPRYNAKSQEEIDTEEF